MKLITNTKTLENVYFHFDKSGIFPTFHVSKTSESHETKLKNFIFSKSFKKSDDLTGGYRTWSARKVHTERCVTQSHLSSVGRAHLPNFKDSFSFRMLTFKTPFHLFIKITSNRSLRGISGSDKEACGPLSIPNFKCLERPDQKLNSEESKKMAPSLLFSLSVTASKYVLEKCDFRKENFVRQVRQIRNNKVLFYNHVAHLITQLFEFHCFHYVLLKLIVSAYTVNVNQPQMCKNNS